MNIVAGASLQITLADNPSLDTADFTIGLKKPRTPVAGWYGWMPLIATDGPTVRVPYAHDGTSVTLTLARAYAWIEARYSTDLTFRFQRSNGGAAFAEIAHDDLTVLAGNQERLITSFAAGSLVSGQLLRLQFRQPCPDSQFLAQVAFQLS